MPQITKYSADRKIQILHEYLSGQSSGAAIAKKYDISVKTLEGWNYHYKTDGYEWFLPKHKNKVYSAELKYQAVKDYLTGNYTLYEIMNKYGIRHRSRLCAWISMYNGHGTLKSSNTGGASAMTRRTTSLDERMDIVLHCISIGCDYAKTALEYQVSYHQVYQWVKKYKTGGKDALNDGRGKRKSEDELSDADKNKRAVKKLEQEIELLRMENALLKKLNEIEGK